MLDGLQPNVFRKVRPAALPYVVYGIVHGLPFFWACDCGNRAVYLECRTDISGTQIATEADLLLKACGERCPSREHELSAPAEVLLCCAVQSASLVEAGPRVRFLCSEYQARFIPEKYCNSHFATPWAAADLGARIASATKLCDELILVQRDEAVSISE